MALSEQQTRSVVFVNARQEAGINEVYDPDLNAFLYQVFIHNQFPYSEQGSWHFDEFSKARSFAAETFAKDWEMLVWDKDIKRPCSEGGGGCGTEGGSCGSKEGGCGSGGGCGSSGGGCGSEGGGCGSA